MWALQLEWIWQSEPHWVEKASFLPCYQICPLPAYNMPTKNFQPFYSYVYWLNWNFFYSRAKEMDIYPEKENGFQALGFSPWKQHGPAFRTQEMLRQYDACFAANSSFVTAFPFSSLLRAFATALLVPLFKAGCDSINRIMPRTNNRHIKSNSLGFSHDHQKPKYRRW